MDSEEEYELLPHGKIEYLRTEIDRLKTDKILQSGAQSHLLEAVQKLHKAIDKLYDLFDNVEKDLLDEYKEDNSPNITMQKLIEQNEQIINLLKNNGLQIESNQMPKYSTREISSNQNFPDYQPNIDASMQYAPNSQPEVMQNFPESKSVPKTTSKISKQQPIESLPQNPLPTSNLNKKMRQVQNARQKNAFETENNTLPTNNNFSQPTQQNFTNTPNQQLANNEFLQQPRQQGSANNFNSTPRQSYNNKEDIDLSEFSKNTQEPNAINPNFPGNNFPPLPNKKEFDPPIDVKPKSKKFLGIFGK